jgi:hypothetical protein
MSSLGIWEQSVESDSEYLSASQNNFKLLGEQPLPQLT